MDKELLENALYPISDQELNRRWRAVRNKMKDAGLDCLVLQNSESFMCGYVRWFTDIPTKFGTPITVIFPLEEEMTIITEGNIPSLTLPPWMMRGIREDIVLPYYRGIHYTNRQDGDAAAAVLKKGGYQKIGLVAPAAMSAATWRCLKESLPGAEFVDFTEETDSIKCVKSEEEITLIKKAADIVDAAFAAVPALVRPGRREYEVANDIRHLLVELGSEEQMIVVGSAPMGAPASHKMDYLMKRILQPGDQVLVMLEVSGPGGMYQEVGRTICIGEPSKRLLRGWEIAREAQQQAAALMKKGALPAEIAAFNERFMRERDYPNCGMIFSHGQGYELAERPVIYEAETMRIEENMNIAIHPFGITEDAYVFCCDNFLTGINGAVRLSHVPQEILVAGAGTWK